MPKKKKASKYILVLRKEGDAEFERIWCASHIEALIKKLCKLQGRKFRRKSTGLGTKYDQTIRAMYRRVPATEIAAHLAEIRKRPVTKNMVISRALALGLVRRRGYADGTPTRSAQMDCGENK